MHGFGDDTRFLAGTAATDAQRLALSGFGAPSAVGTEAVVEQSGFGSPSEWSAFGITVQAPSPEFEVYPDDGGVLVRLFGTWMRRGPWVVQLTSDAGVTLYPLEEVGCYSAEIGDGHLCYTDRFQRTLTFCLPPLPLGTYDVWVDDPALGLNGLIIIEDGIEVVTRGQAEETYVARRTWPLRYPTGPRGWGLEDATLPTLPLKPLRALTRMMGETAQETAGAPQTRLLQAHSLGDTSIVVETLLGFPTGGEIWVGPLRYKYQFVTVPPAAPGFVNLTLVGSSGSVTELPAYTPVTLAAELPGRIYEALEDTLIAKADGVALDILSRMYGIPRPPPLPSSYWRKALHAAAMGPRDRLGTLMEVLLAMFEPWTEQTLTFVNLEAANPQKLMGGTWSCTHTHRLIDIPSKGIYWSVAEDGDELTLASIGTTYWKGANWVEDENLVAVRVLPFFIREDGGIFRVYVDSELVDVPPTYLLPDAESARPAGQPIGGALLENAQVRAQFEGPVYLPGEGPFRIFERVIDSLCAAGIHAVLEAYTWCEEVQLGLGSLHDFSLFGYVVPGGIPDLADLEGWEP